MARRAEDLEMAVIICLAGAVVGLIIGTVSGRLVLPMVLRSLEERLRDPTFRLSLPAALSDALRLRALTIAVYRYVMPLVFASAGSAAAYYLFIADAP
jgi:hypothetical protein